MFSVNIPRWVCVASLTANRLLVTHSQADIKVLAVSI